MSTHTYPPKLAERYPNFDSLQYMALQPEAVALLAAEAEGGEGGGGAGAGQVQVLVGSNPQHVSLATVEHSQVASTISQPSSVPRAPPAGLALG